jgi:hypothetical protein
MNIHFGKFLHTPTGRYVMSLLLGFGLATLFRAACEGKKCYKFVAPPPEEYEGKIYKDGSSGKCYKYSTHATKCVSGKRTIGFADASSIPTSITSALGW